MMDRIFDEIEQYVKQLHDDFEKTRKSIEEFIEARKQDLVTSVRRTTELLRPAVVEASKQAKVEVKQEGEKLIAEVHGRAEITDQTLKEQILKHLGEQKVLEEKKEGA